jgi:hypothetical protein
VTRIAALAAALVLLAPAAAAAQQPVPPPPPPPAAPPPPPPPAAIALALNPAHVLHAGKDPIILQGHSVVLNGQMTPPVLGQRVDLRVFRDGKKRRTRHAVTAADGRFSLRISKPSAGRLSVRASHAATPQLGAGRARKVTVAIVAPRASAGLRSPLVRLLQRGLAKLHYVVPRTGTFDLGTGRAVMAFRKVNGMARSFDADRRVVTRVLAGKGTFKPRRPDAGRHAEADLSRQVLALIDHGKVQRIYHMSSGKPSTPTVIGSFQVYLKTPGTNAKGMVDSNYFIRGYAIHGYIDVPAFNASHGCLRVPIPNARSIYAWLHYGNRVIVYP